MDPDAVEIRVLGCLIEKQRTTPDAYPLSLNALRLACNQSTNRDPVVQYDESVIRDALQHLYRRGWTRLTSGHGSRAAKYRHLLDEALGLRRDEIALLAVLMLRGPQTPGELKQRVERMQHFDDLTAVHATLDALIAAGRVARLERRPGQKEERYQQLLGGEEAEQVATAPPMRPAPVAASSAPAASGPAAYTASASVPAAAAPAAGPAA
ncbi:YceH family protein, partial [Conexibacter stalactiti]